jgi:hypothetical protein
MYKLWLVLGMVSLLTSILGFSYQEIFRHSPWNWSQLKTIESAVSMTVSVAGALLVVAAVEYIRTRKPKGGKK